MGLFSKKHSKDDLPPPPPPPTGMASIPEPEHVLGQPPLPPIEEHHDLPSLEEKKPLLPPTLHTDMIKETPEIQTPGDELPPLPEPHEMADLPPLPDLPDIEEKLPPVEDLPELEEQLPKMHRLGPDELPALGPMPKEERPASPLPEMEEKAKGPIFVGVEAYKEILFEISEVKANITKADTILKNLNDIRTRKDVYFEKFRSQLEDLQRKSQHVDKSLFEGGIAQ